jgi:hypothetical protein
MEAKKAFGLVTALGTRLGERARDEPDLPTELRAAPDVEAFRAIVRQKAEGRVPPAVLDAFLGEVVTAEDWVLWRSRLLLQLKMVREGGRPAPGHEAGKKGASPGGR